LPFWLIYNDDIYFLCVKIYRQGERERKRAYVWWLIYCYYFFLFTLCCGACLQFIIITIIFCFLLFFLEFQWGYYFQERNFITSKMPRGDEEFSLVGFRGIFSCERCMRWRDFKQEIIYEWDLSVWAMHGLVRKYFEDLKKIFSRILQDSSSGKFKLQKIFTSGLFLEL
jgi:hypothetical protein